MSTYVNPEGTYYVVVNRTAQRPGKQSDDGDLDIDDRNGLGVSGDGEQNKAEDTRGC
jgi:hypothetical protein